MEDPAKAGRLMEGDFWKRKALLMSIESGVNWFVVIREADSGQRNCLLKGGERPASQLALHGR
jgi:hypothetical protein